MAENETTITKGLEYRPINIEFLDRSGNELFDIFYKTKYYGSVKYVKFASSNPEHQEKVRRLLETGDCTEDFYIHEKDLFKYYSHATKTLSTLVKNPRVPLKVKTEKIYDVSKTIMKEFFDYNASSKVLSSSEEVMGLMDDCMSTSDMGFYAVSQLTNKDYYTYTHSVNVGIYCMTFGVKSKMPSEEVRQLGLGGMLHDVGKSKIPHELINKDGKLTDDEFEKVKFHAPLGAEILNELNCYTHNVVSMAAQHHEKFEGGGYPKGLVGDEISMYARICKIMDVYDALTTRRSYKKAMTAYDALTLMRKQMASDFDTHLLDRFIVLMGPEI